MSGSERVPAGLCTDCRHGQRVGSRRSSFLRCRRSDSDPAYPRYPALPVLACPGHEPAARPRENAEEAG